MPLEWMKEEDDTRSEPDPGEAGLSGRVFDAVNVEALQSAQVSVSTGEVTVTDEDGNFFFASLTAGEEIVIQVEAEGHAVNCTPA